MNASLADCRDCAAAIRFVKLDTGTTIPINPLPNPSGNVAALQVGARLHGYVVTGDNPPSPAMTVYMPHAATCVARLGAADSKVEHPALF